MISDWMPGTGGAPSVVSRVYVGEMSVFFSFLWDRR